MPHASLRLVGGAIQNETPALNQAGISSCNLIRLKPDPNGLSLPEKLGGWAKFWPIQVTNGPARALWAYQDTQARKWLIYGTDNPNGAQLEAVEGFTNTSTGITTGSSSSNYYYDITPRYQSDSVAANFASVSGSNTVTVTDDTITGVTQYDTVYITTPIAVGGLIISGMYPIQNPSLSQNTYEILITDVLGNVTPASFSTVASPITVTGGSFSAGTPNTITLTWATPSYTFSVGSAVVVNSVNPTTVNGTWIVTASTATSVTFATTLGSFTWVSGGALSNYGTTPIFNTTNGSNLVTVQLPSHGLNVGDTFYILNQTVVNGMTLFGDYKVASVTDAATFTINGPQVAGSTGYQFQNAISVVGGSADGAHVTLSLGNSTYVTPSITVTSGTGSGTHVTLNWTTPAYEFQTGQTIIVSGVNPSAWNGSYVVTSSSTTSVTYANTNTGPYVSGGAIVNAQYNVGAFVWVSGVNPTDWNGWYVVTSVTATTVSYANASSNHAWVSGGSISDNGGDEDFIYSIGLGPTTVGSGYGVGGYGVGGYGTGQTQPTIGGTTISATNWELNNWGDLTIALAVESYPINYLGQNLPFQPIYYWDPTNGQQIAQVISQGPPASNGMFVAMPQRQIIAWGTTFSGIIDPLLIRWCDVNNYTTWIAQITNQAGSFRLSSGAEIMGALQTPQQGLIWTDIELWSMQYISQPLVYGFNKIGQGCGLIARHAAASLNGIVYWMSNTQFFTLSGNGVQPIVCPIWDVIFQDLDRANVRKITCAANSLFQEITWYYPVNGGNGEVSAYVRFNTILNAWDFGTLGRSAWIDVSVMGQPIGFDPSAKYVYQHEISPDADGAAMAPTFTTGYFALSDVQGSWALGSMASADQKTYLDEFWPDMKWGYYGQGQGASVQLTFNVVDFPGQTPTTFGPYTVTQSTQWINPRFRGRLVSITISSDDVGSFWRLGNPRYRIQSDGRY